MEGIMEFGREAVAEHLVKNNMPRFKDWKLDLSGAIDGMMDFNTKLDEIARDIRDKKDNAMAMEFVKVIGGMLVQNGVSLKIEECRDESIEMNMAKNKIEVKYNVRIDGLDFSEHDKVFEDRIEELETLLQKQDEFLDMKNLQINELKQRIAELESEKLENCEKDAISDDVKPSSAWYENRYQQDCITINHLNTTIDVLIHKVEYLRQFAGLE
jgi:hypothetical protein